MRPLMSLRLSLLAVFPLSMLVGCATVKPRPTEPVATTEAVTVAAPGGLAKLVPVPVTAVELGTAEVAPTVVATQWVSAGVLEATLRAAEQVTGPASTTGRFWDVVLAPTQMSRSIVQRSLQLVGMRSLRRVSRGVPDDCSGFVRLAYRSAGIDLVAHGFRAGENAVSAIFRRAVDVGSVHHQPPRPGDLVFFRETYDRNRDGRRNDGMTHIGVVEAVDAHGTVTFIHRGGKGVARGRLNLSFPSRHQLEQGGPVVNDYIRPAAKGSRAYLAGELFAAFASPEGL
ncbi:CHAP domain-containing protein [Myxococcus sp. NMCA1]|uniref:CHAP domain-containing protein n=1 Tax=Myxococcus sp. NMCA1 TaxID=2996785 RepID=UPI002E1BFB82